MKNTHNQPTRKPVKKTKPTKTTITTKDGKSFDVTEKDFLYFLNESFTELFNQSISEHTKEQREILFETYFAFRFLAREFNWKKPKEIKEFRKVIDDYFKQYLSENN